MTTNKDNNEAPEHLYVQLTGVQGPIFSATAWDTDPREVHDNGKPVYIYRRVDPPACQTCGGSGEVQIGCAISRSITAPCVECGGSGQSPQEYARHRERGHDAAEQLIAEGEPMTQQSDTERLSYEILLTDKWDEHNRRRLELITRKQSAPLTESESEELHRLQWLAGIKRELTHGPLPLPLIDSQAELAHAARTPMGVSIAESAATAMRDTCVEKVRECLAERARTPPESEDYEYDQAVCFVLYGVIDKLALLTLDNCES